MIRMSWAALGLGHIFQGGVEDVQVDNVLQLLKVEKGGLGRNRYRGTNMIPIFHLNKWDKALPEKGEDFVEHVIFPILNATKDFAENPSSTSPEHVSHRVTSCLGEKSGVKVVQYGGVLQAVLAPHSARPGFSHQLQS